jgi:hypothetical protein
MFDDALLKIRIGLKKTFLNTIGVQEKGQIDDILLMNQKVLMSFDEFELGQSKYAA